jgi:hypothetical protein
MESTPKPLIVDRHLTVHRHSFGKTDLTANVVRDTETVTVSGNGTYVTPAGLVPTAAGTCQWVATYIGDVSNLAVSSAPKRRRSLVNPPM